ncbi:MAG: hypothetical protein F4Y90_07375 [Rhodothermaceae bacterium]|nr:hypothetical protein [Rhodothermaceae bacterium]
MRKRENARRYAEVDAESREMTDYVRMEYHEKYRGDGGRIVWSGHEVRTDTVLLTTPERARKSLDGSVSCNNNFMRSIYASK